MLYKILEKAKSTFAIKVLGSAAAYMMHILLARWAGSSEYGIYVYLMAWASMLSLPSRLGFETSLVRFIPEYRETENYKLINGIIKSSSLYTVILGGLISGLGILGIRVYSKPEGSYALYLLPVLVIGHGLMKNQMAILRGYKKMKKAYSPVKLGKPVLIVLVVGFTIWLSKRVSAVSIIFGVGFAYLVVVSYQRCAINKLQNNFKQGIKYKNKDWLRVSLPLLLVSGSLLLLNRTDVIMLGVFSNKSDVGIYNSAHKTAKVVTLIMVSINSIFGPIISEMYASKKFEELKRITEKVAHLIFWPSLVLSIILFFYGESVLALFGSEFSQGVTVLRILICGQLVNAGAGSVGYLLNMTGHQNLSAYIFSTVALLNIILNIIFVPRYGPVGAAFATAISMSLWNIGLAYIVYRKLTIHSTIVGVSQKQIRRYVT